MKISTFITMILFVGIVMFVVISMVNEADDNYGINVNKTNWEGQYNFASDVNDSISPIKTSIDDITSEDTGWLEKVGAGFTGIIAAVTFLPSMVWDLGKMGTSLITGLGDALGVPSAILFTIIIGLIVWGIIELIQFYQRWNM